MAHWNIPEMSGLALLLKVLRTDSRLASMLVVLVANKLTKGQVIEAGEPGSAT